MIKLNQNTGPKPYTDMNTKLRKKAKNNFEKYFFKLINSAVFRKTLENVRKYRHIKLVTTDWIRGYLVSKPNYHITELFTDFTLLAIKWKKTQILANKSVPLGLSILDLSKTVMYDFWYDYVKPKHSENTKLYYMDTYSIIVQIKTAFLWRHCRRC